MGGGGGGSYQPPRIDRLQELVAQARQQDKAETVRSIDELLQQYLIKFNERDTQKTQERLMDIKNSIEVDLETMLFGGSIAKHTYVDGLSDVDAIALIDRDNTQGFSAQDALQKFYEDIDANLPRHSGVQKITKGRLAVTITYDDGNEVQVLPGVRVGNEIRIPDASGQGWKSTTPKEFREKLTAQNQRLNNNLLPAIKIVKALISDLPDQQRPTGYHMESLAVDAVRGHKGDSSTRVLIDLILRRSTDRVLFPMADVTGQSRNVDEHLGPTESSARRLISQGLGAIQRRLNAASAIQWAAMLDLREEK